MARFSFLSSLLPLRVAAAAAALSSLAGCGQLEGDTVNAPVVATIRGQLANPAGYAAGANLRVAIVWGIESGGGRSAQDVAVKPVFPSQFQLDLRALPPLDAMQAPGKKKGSSSCSAGYDPSSGKAPPAADGPCDDAPPMAGGVPTPRPVGVTPQGGDLRPAQPGDPFRIALGALIAYEDLNGNGQLDLLDDGATAAIDRVVGVNEEVMIVYAEGTATGEFAEVGVPRGFSQVHVGACAKEVSDATGGSGGPASAPIPAAATEADCGKNMIRPIDALLTLPLTAQPRFGDFMCRGEGSTMGVSAAAPPPAAKPGSIAADYQFPAASDPKLRCKADGSSYTYAPCESSQNLCGDRLICESVEVTRPTPTPSGWPCR